MAYGQKLDDEEDRIQKFEYNKDTPDNVEI